MRFFLAGTMRGSEKGDSFASQGYRVELKEILKAQFRIPMLQEMLLVDMVLIPADW